MIAVNVFTILQFPDCLAEKSGFGGNSIVANNVREYDTIKHNKYSSLVWIEKNENHLYFGEKTLKLQRDNIVYCIKIVSLHNEKHIEIICSDLVELERLYLWVGEIRRFDYLFDGAFYTLQNCIVDNENITDIVQNIEVGYFQNAKYLHKIPFELDEKSYKKYFLKWLVQEKKLGIINQMVLYANNVKGLPADVRISMLIECYEALAKKLEKKKLITITPEKTTNRQVKCPNCNHPHSISVKGKKTLACCLLAILERFGKPVFMTEYRRKRSLVNHIVKTRNKVFHVNSRQKKTLKGSQSGFYVIKLDWLYRYIILVLIGIDKKKLDEIVDKQILKFEQQYPALIYKVKK